MRVAGSRWLLNPKGDYDFSAMAFTPLIYFFDDQPDRLWPETKEHVLKYILTIEGDKFTKNVPRSFIEDTENHILMTESSRYLKNQWLRQHGNMSPEYDNKTNGVEKGLVEYLKSIDECGMWEFNSEPYLGYAFSALLNLDALAEGEVKELARKILDRENWYYALGSYNFKHFPPYRRRFGKNFRKGLDVDYHTAMMKAWISFYTDSLDLKLKRGQHHALWAAMMPYRPADKVVEWTLRKPNTYYVKIGRGTKSCPEIYSGDPAYLLSAGGANRGRLSLIMPKAITLFLNDDATTLEEVFYLYGPGEDKMDWNNSGVYKRFACAAGPVHVPKNYHPVARDNNWRIFRIALHRLLAIHSQDDLGIFYIHHGNDAEGLLKELELKNPDRQRLHQSFTCPNGDCITYDLTSPHDKWVITSINRKPVERYFDNWVDISGNLKID